MPVRKYDWCRVATDKDKKRQSDQLRQEISKKKSISEEKPKEEEMFPRIVEEEKQ